MATFLFPWEDENGDSIVDENGDDIQFKITSASFALGIDIDPELTLITPLGADFNFDVNISPFLTVQKFLSTTLRFDLDINPSADKVISNWDSIIFLNIGNQTWDLT